MAIKQKRRQLKLFRPQKHGSKYSFNQVVEEMNKRGYVLLSDESDFDNCASKMKYICPKHEEYGVQNTTLAHLREGKGCYYCGHILAGLNRRLDLELLSANDIKRCEELDFTYINTNRKPNKDGDLKIYVNFICNKHKNKGVQSVERDAFYKLKGCKYCASKDLTIDDFNERLHKINPTISLIQKEKDICKPNLFQCSICGNIWEGYYYQLTNCPYCNPRHSLGETMVNRVLKNHNIDFEEQKKFDDCVLKSKLSFDFYIESLNICIEYQGKQHYEPVKHFGGKDQFELQQTRDNIKSEYCKSNNIQLIKIPYTINTVDKIEECLSTFSIF